MIKLAIQKSGRLTDDSLELMRECGLDFNKSGTLKSPAFNFPLEFLFLRDDDIPAYVADGVADIGIVGENVLVEAEAHSAHIKTHVDIAERLGFSRCRLSLAIPKEQVYGGVQSLQGKRIATSFPHILQTYLADKGVVADIHEISGSVEIAPSIGLADAICDIVSSGSTLMSNGLKEAEIIYRSEAVMIQGKHLTSEQIKVLDDLRFRIHAVSRAKKTKYIVLNAPTSSLDRILAILPGIKSPTVTPLADKGWSAVHSVVPEDTFWEIIGRLRSEGAQGILVLPIEKMIV